MSLGKLPNLKLLYVFSTVVKCQGYARAQQELNLTTSAISNYMSELEDKLGFTLCHRGRGGFSLTPKGESFWQQSLSLLNSLEDFDRCTNALCDEQSGTLRIGLIDATVTNEALPFSHVIQQFNDKYPHIHLHLEIKNPHALLQGILDHELDIAIGNFPIQSNSVVHHPLYLEQHWLYCSHQHELFNKKDINNIHIAQARMVTRSYWSSSDLGRRGFQKSTATVESMEAQLLLILSGKYIGYLPDHYAKPWIDNHQLRLLLPEHYGYQAPFSLIFRRGRNNETTIRTFRDIVRSATFLDHRTHQRAAG